MAESRTPKTKKLTRDPFPRDSSAIREDTEQIVSSHQDKHGYMGHGIAKMETKACCRHEAQKHQQSGSQKAKVMDIKEEVRDMDSECPEQFEVLSREKCLSSHEIPTEDLKDEVTEKEVDFHRQLEYFNSDQCVSDQEIIMTDLKDENEENLSIFSGKECTQNINSFFEHKMYGIKVKDELMENDAELHNYFDVYNIEEYYSPPEFILKNVKGEIIENEANLTGDLKVQNSEKCINQELNKINVMKEVAETETYSSEQLKLFNNYHCFSDEKITITDVKGAVTDDETDFLGLVKITNIKTCDSAQTFNNTLVKKEEPEYDVEFPQNFETLYYEQSGSVDKIIITNVKSGVAENERNLPRELRGQTVEKTVSEQKSNAAIIKDEEIDRNLPDNSVYVLNQVSAKDITEEKTQKLHNCNVCNKRFRSKEKFTRHMKRKNHQKREFKCEICDKVFYRTKYLNRHMNGHTKEKEFKCKFCDKIFYCQVSLSKHLNLHTKEKEYKCEICDKIYYQRSSLAKHMETYLNEAQRSCKFCGKLLSTPQKLKIHLNLHMKEKKFKCDLCYKFYFLKSALIKHVQSHSIEEHRTCKICGKLFSTPNNLKLHINTHTKEKKFKCNVCYKVYFLKAALIRHVESHSFEEQRTCKICGKLFTTKQSLKRHLNLHTQRK